MFTYADKIIELNKKGLSWHDASVQARKEYQAQFDCTNCEGITSPDYNHDGHDEPTEDLVIIRIVKEYGLRIVRFHSF